MISKLHSRPKPGSLVALLAKGSIIALQKPPTSILPVSGGFLRVTADH